MASNPALFDDETARRERIGSVLLLAPALPEHIRWSERFLGRVSGRLARPWPHFGHTFGHKLQIGVEQIGVDV